jgi:two-component system sensor histidine kinase DesK
MRSRQPDRVFIELADIEQNARQALAQVRAVVRGYRTEGAIAECANARAALTEAGIECSVAHPAAVPAHCSDTLAMVAREAATNVLRHSQAKHCTIRLSTTQRTIQLSVEDDGVGCVDRPEGQGLKGMRERLSALGGRLSVTPRAGGGTSLVAEVPHAVNEAARPA